MARRLYRSRDSSVFAGVCGGLGEYFDIDPVIFRILAVLLIFASGIGLLAYIVAWIAMPKRPSEVVTTPPADTKYMKYLPGAILIVIGLIFLARNLLWWFSFGLIWPLALIIAGALLVARSLSRSEDKGEAHESVAS